MNQIPSVTKLMSLLDLKDQPWLIVGKGPTQSLFAPELRNRYRVFALNHVMRDGGADVGHAIDLEVFSQMSLKDLEGVSFLVVPWVPHVRLKRPLYSGDAFFGPGKKTLEQILAENPVLSSFHQRGRLFTYNLMSAPASLQRGDLMTVPAESFSAAVALRLLAELGVRDVRTLGVDGGSRYSPQFSDLEQTTKLQTHQTSFDSQFQEMAVTIQKFDLLAGPLNAQVPVEVFVGCMPEQDLAFKVLEYSIHRHASISVRVRRLHDAVAGANIAMPQPADPTARGRTPFSFQRFAIPEICQHTGRAIYVDSDMLVLRDIREMWLADMESRQMLSAAQAPGSTRRPQFSVMLLDCEKLDWDVKAIVNGLDAKRYSYAQLMYEMCSVSSWAADLPHGWNSLEMYDPAQTRLVHFTDMDSQPWLNAWHPIGPLWCRYLLDAIDGGAISFAEVEHEIEAGHVRPSLAEQVRRNEPDARCLPFSVLRKDVTTFFPPHRKAANTASRWKHEVYRMRVLAKHQFQERMVGPTIKRARRFASSVLGAMSHQ